MTCPSKEVQKIFFEAVKHDDKKQKNESGFEQGLTFAAHALIIYHLDYGNIFMQFLL